MNQANRHPSSKSLAALRAMIDEVDHEVLRALVKRNELVAQIARYKREHRLHIRDLTREREIIKDRSRQASSLGLPPDLIESIFRLILWGSRDRQAALKAELPIEIEPKSVAIIGGNGGMGYCFTELFSDLGHTVTIADVNTQLTPVAAAESADVVIISVPIDATIDVIREVGPCVRPDALLMDVTSIKTAPVAEMLNNCEGSVVGTHPLFAPSVHSLQGQRVVLCQGRGDDWYNWLNQMLTARGLVIHESTAQEHDQAMAIVQVLTHFSTEVMGQTLARLGVNVEQTRPFTSPVYLMELLMTARHFAQSSDLYASIQMSNPQTPAVTQAFVDAAQTLANVVQQADRPAFRAMFAEVRSILGSFTDEALEQSSFLIDRLVERTSV